MTETRCPPLTTEEVQGNLQAAFDEWFVRLQALSKGPLKAEDWTERWFDGYTPEAALEDGSLDDGHA